MNGRSDETTLLRAYLLATLPEPERLELAGRYFADDDLFEQLVSEEADLIDEYVDGELSPEDRRLFEQSLGTIPGRADRVVFARALGRMPPEADVPAGRTPMPIARLSVWLAAAAAILLAALAGLWVFRLSSQQEDALRELRSERDRLAARERQLAAELQELRKQLDSRAGTAASATQPTKPPLAAVERTATFLLTAGLSREAAGVNRLQIPATAASVRLQLVLEPDSAGRSRVRIQRPDASELLRRENLRPVRTPAGLVLSVEIPAAQLPEGDYVALVEDASNPGAEPVEEYFFRVTR